MRCISIKNDCHSDRTKIASGILFDLFKLNKTFLSRHLEETEQDCGLRLKQLAKIVPMKLGQVQIIFGTDDMWTKSFVNIECSKLFEDIIYKYGDHVHRDAIMLLSQVQS